MMWKIKEDGTKKKIVVGMSGGVDSTVALILLKKEGWIPIGVTLKLPVWEDKRNLLRENVCCTTQTIKMAGEICKKLNVPYHVLDGRSMFKKRVISYFTSELKEAKTPNPCIICNRYLKYKLLFDFGKKVGAKYVATGHYARKRFNKETRKYELLIARDNKKDQTYSLCFLPQKWLKYIVFPLGEYTKEEVYRMAEKEGMKFYQKVKQSQDFCFVAGKTLSSFIQEELAPKHGKIVDKSGKVVGEHCGLPHYTIGQRQRIRLHGGPYYVVGLDIAKNVLYVSKDKRDLLRTEILIEPYSFISGERLTMPIYVNLRARYHQKLVLALLKPSTKTGRLKAVLKQPISSPTPGQFAVFYKGQICLGGGRIVDTR